MRKAFAFLCLTAFLLTSCSFKRFFNRNRLFECRFSCELNDVYYFFEIEEISKNSYENAKNLNVIEEYFNRSFNSKYYSISFYSSLVKDPNSKVLETYNFYNLQGGYPGRQSIGVNYKDQTGSTISPRHDYDGYKNAYYVWLATEDQTFWLYKDKLEVYI